MPDEAETLGGILRIAGPEPAEAELPERALDASREP